MAIKCRHKQDKNWTTDLLWYYTHQAIIPLADTEYTRKFFDSWHGRPDPSKVEEERHKVYRLLLDEPKPASWWDSEVPWNQLNHRFDTFMKNKGFRGLFCGPAVRIFFAKYMKDQGYPKRRLSRNKVEVEKACKQILASLSSYKPLVVGLGHRSRKDVSHHVGIVGHRKVMHGARQLDHFLFLEPYGDDGRWGTMQYGFLPDGSRGSTSFLGELEHDNVRHELAYIGKGLDYCVYKY